MPFTGLWTLPDNTEVVNPRIYFSEELGPDVKEDSIVRFVSLVPPNFSISSLEKLLIRTDKQLDLVAELAGGQVVEHDWALLDSSRYGRYFPPRHWFGNGYYGLLARVNRIEPVLDIPTHVTDQIEGGVSRFYRRPTLARKLSDIEPHQFTYGFDVNDSRRNVMPYLHDIEPIFQLELGIM